MHTLHDLCTARKVIYLGISDTPAWIVVKANDYARQHGLRQFSIYQGRWSAASRDFEREIIPMCLSEGMALAPWGALGGGGFKTQEQRESNEGRKNTLKVAVTGKEEQVSLVLEEIANKKGTLITSVALAYVMHKYAIHNWQAEHLADKVKEPLRVSNRRWPKGRASQRKHRSSWFATRRRRAGQD